MSTFHSEKYDLKTLVVKIYLHKEMTRKLLKAK